MRLRYVLIFAVLLFVTSCLKKAPVSGLRPEYPENYADGTEIMFVEVDSLRPTLRWESFPRPQDLREDKEGMLYLIKNVTYDLKIWSAEGDYPYDIICSKQGLREPYYMLEEALEPCCKYFWTIRARFKIGGKLRVTEWGISQRGYSHWGLLREINRHRDIGINWSLAIFRRSPIVPNLQLYRFKTPCSTPCPKTTDSNLNHNF
jgi:hypothetical protein